MLDGLGPLLIVQVVAALVAIASGAIVLPAQRHAQPPPQGESPRQWRVFRQSTSHNHAPHTRDR
jgi:hypothetical protein